VGLQNRGQARFWEAGDRTRATGACWPFVKLPNSFKYTHKKTVAHCAGKVQWLSAVDICSGTELGI
jgi:hypothetical protein